MFISTLYQNKTWNTAVRGGGEGWILGSLLAWNYIEIILSSVMSFIDVLSVVVCKKGGLQSRKYPYLSRGGEVFHTFLLCISPYKYLHTYSVYLSKKINIQNISRFFLYSRCMYNITNAKYPRNNQIMIDIISNKYLSFYTFSDLRLETWEWQSAFLPSPPTTTTTNFTFSCFSAPCGDIFL